MIDLLQCGGMRFSANIGGRESTTKGMIFIHNSKVYLFQNDIHGSSPGDRYLRDYGYEYSCIYKKFDTENKECYWTADKMQNFEVENPFKSLADIREIALINAKKIFTDDEFVDVYINAFEDGAKWQEISKK
jgi:hypothetical protein